MSSPAREISDISSVLESSKFLMLVVLSLYWNFTRAFCYVSFFYSSAGFSMCSFGYNGVYCITGQTCCCVEEGTLG